MYPMEGYMFRDEKINIVEINNRSLKLEDIDGKLIALIFIKDNKLIIRSDAIIKEGSIECPKINIL